MTVIETPRAVLRGEDDCPFVDLGDGSELQLLQVDVPNGLWVIRTRFQPGYRVPTHKHTGQVFAFTISGAWQYEEYPEVMTGGSYLYEPAHSVHTLIVPEDATEIADVWFAIYGANLNLDAEGNIESIVDAELVRDGYLMMCEDQGKGTPNVIGID